MKAITLILAMGFGLALQAQDAEITKAQASLKDGNRREAIRNLREAQTMIVGEMLVEMEKALPQKVGEFELAAAQNNSKSSSLRFERRYQKAAQEGAEKKEEEGRGAGGPGDMREMMDSDGMGGYQSMSVYISDNLSEANMIFMAHSLSEEGNAGEGEAVMIGKAKAVIQDRGDWKSIEMIIGGAYIRLNGQGMKEIDTLMDLAKAIDADKLIAVLGD